VSAASVVKRLLEHVAERVGLKVAAGLRNLLQINLVKADANPAHVGEVAGADHLHDPALVDDLLPDLARQLAIRALRGGGHAENQRRGLQMSEDPPVGPRCGVMALVHDGCPGATTAYVFFPWLISSFTFEPDGRLARGFGFWEITRPFITLAENTLVTFPSEQCAFLSARLAARSVLPFSLGTTQRTLNVAVTERAALMATVQVPVPEQAPDQPANLERADAVAVSFTAVPYGKARAQVARLAPSPRRSNADLDLLDDELQRAGSEAWHQHSDRLAANSAIPTGMRSSVRTRVLPSWFR
jgi:hypothetical protein